VTNKVKQNKQKVMRRALRLMNAAKAFEHTLNLPNSRFAMRANAVQNEPKLLDLCSSRVYSEQAADLPTFVLHDGPPYANGEPHVGHALNKCLKDMVNRKEMLENKRVVYVPGWDCHGLPIELKAVNELPKGQPLTPEGVGRVAKACAQRELAVQMQAFKSWAVMGDWERRYETMDPKYEASQLRAFRAMIANGKVHRGEKPVWWSPATRTALAEAELVYEEKHKSQSVWVAFAVQNAPNCACLQELVKEGREVALVAWTTTPWTLPANRALVVSEELKYSALGSNGKVFVVATALVDEFIKAVGLSGSKVLHDDISGAELVQGFCAHPLVAGKSVPVLAGDFVTTDVGTGVVHAAPGHGQDDYLVCGQAGIGPFSPVDDVGRFTDDVGVEGLTGLEVLGEGTRRVIEMLRASGRLLQHRPYEHKYPYDWRSKTPVIVRSTPQWFLNSQQLKPLAEEALCNVRFVPEAGRAKMLRTVTARMEDWCISRQRFWGVPIPAFFDAVTGEALMSEETVDAFLARMAATGQGVSCWWSSSVAELLPPRLANESARWVKGTDTMDVWMDSGLSWAHMADRGVAVPMDMVLEGTDQYRGWFQSLLLTWLAAGHKGAPFRCVVVHGFCLDSNGVKMSKSVGNVIPPSALTHGVKSLPGEPKGFEPNGVDVMRLWIASHDYSRDLSVSRAAVDAIAKHYRKIRTTLRWLLGVLEDYDPKEPVQRQGYLSQHLLWLVSQAETAVRADYANLNFAGVAQRVAEFISELSSIHVESMKDALYCNAAKDPTGLRQSNQLALFAALRFLVASLMPIVPHTMADVKQSAAPQLELHALKTWGAGARAVELPLGWKELDALRNTTNRLLEGARNAKVIGSPLDARVHLVLSSAALDKPLELLGAQETACFFGSVSQVDVTRDGASVKSAFQEQVHLENGIGKVVVAVDAVGQNKCPRCWTRGGFEHLCPRCSTIKMD
jgi:isoleucyl-tRNA synthetase